MQEVGGYIEFGGLINKPYHKNCLDFNSSRNALKYFIRFNKIKKIYLPFYLCEVVYRACVDEKCDIVLYHIDKDFMPILDDYDGYSYIYLVNYYGLISNDKIKKMMNKYKNLIVDNTHSFFQKPVTNSIYNCRKYFGVADGAYLYSNIKKNDEIEPYVVNDKIGHLIGRLEENAATYYTEFSNNDKKFDKGNIYKMSNFSKIIMGAIDYKSSYKIRIDNFNYLNEKLKKFQKLSLPNNLTFMYPLYVDEGKKVRDYLISKKIYIPKLWPNIVEENNLSKIELEYINNILPLPIDQRYSKEDMDFIISSLEEICEEV